MNNTKLATNLNTQALYTPSSQIGSSNLLNPVNGLSNEQINNNHLNNNNNLSNNISNPNNANTSDKKNNNIRRNNDEDYH